MAIGLIVVFCGLFYYVYNRRANTDYEGKIVDRWAGYSEGQEGSRPYFRLRVETDDGKQFVINVNPDVYELARVGMRIKSRSGQIVLIESNRNQTSTK